MGAHADDGRHAETSRGVPRRHALPLRLIGSLGSVGYKDKPMFEYNHATSEFQYDGAKGGTAWRTKVDRYMVYKAPALKELLEWSEARDGDYIDNHVVVKACAAKLSEEQATAVNS